MGVIDLETAALKEIGTKGRDDLATGAAVDAGETWQLLFASLDAAPAPSGNPTPPVSTEPQIDRFESEIKDLESEPRPRDGSTVFLGSSTFARWSAIDSEFKSFDAHNLAFGGSTLPEINHYFDRLFAGFVPKQVVLYAGTNDIGDNHHDGRRVFNDFVQFDRKFHQEFPDAEEYFVSISVSPSRYAMKSDYDEANKLIHDYMSHEPHDHYIDVTPLMYDATGHLNTSLFGPDNLHMVKDGYDLWEPIIKDALEHPERYH